MFAILNLHPCKFLFPDEYGLLLLVIFWMIFRNFYVDLHADKFSYIIYLITHEDLILFI